MRRICRAGVALVGEGSTCARRPVLCGAMSRSWTWVASSCSWVGRGVVVCLCWAGRGTLLLDELVHINHIWMLAAGAGFCLNFRTAEISRPSPLGDFEIVCRLLYSLGEHLFSEGNFKKRCFWFTKNYPLHVRTDR